MITGECELCGKIFKCNGDKICEVRSLSESHPIMCFCKECTKIRFPKDYKDYKCVYYEEKEKVNFT